VGETSCIDRCAAKYWQVRRTRCCCCNLGVVCVAQSPAALPLTVPVRCRPSALQAVAIVGQLLGSAK
jgi:hypothetical protein